jgi:UDP-glucuronate 4-epimerase
MKVLVTGGAGFIGSHLCERLLARGDELLVLDNFNDFYDPAIKRANAAGLQGARIVEGDIRDADLVGKLFEEFHPEALVHLAAMAGVRPSLEDPLLYQDVNVRGTMVLLEALRASPDTRFVFASSSSVYGGNEKVPFSEADELNRPVSPYAATKRAGELIAFTYHHLFGIPTTCLRFFTVFGPRQRPEMAIHKFVALVLKGEAIPFFGDGESRRDYTYVDDIVAGVLAAIDRCEGYEIYNLGESQTTSLAELVQMIGEVCGRAPILERLPNQAGDVPVTCADISRAQANLDYQPSTTVRAGLESFLAWYLDGPGASSSGAEGAPIV